MGSLMNRFKEIIVTQFLRLGTNAVILKKNTDGSESEISLAELAVLDGITATTAELNRLDDDNAVMSTGAGSGITGGTGTIYESSVIKLGEITRTEILIDLTGLTSAATLGDIIGLAATANPCHFGRITAARNAGIFGGTVACLETPAGGEVDIDIYSATEATGVTDGAIGSLTETQLLDTNADWTIGTVKALGALPAADQYLYLTTGTSSTPTAGAYTAGKFLITLYGI